jgi:hypothetical protein
VDEDGSDLFGIDSIRIATFLEPIISSSKNLPRSRAPHIFVVAHGIFNAELLGAFLSRRAPGQDPIHWKSGGMTNTGWTRIEVGHHDEEYFDEEETSKEVGLSKPGEGTSNPSSTEPSGGPDLKRTGDKPYLKIKILNTNVTTHLDNVKRQGGGIGSTAYDSSQKGIKDFFGGGG